MSQLVSRQYRTLCAAISLFLAMFLCGLPMAFTDEPPAPPPAGQEASPPAPQGSGPPSEAGDVQERAVIRDQRTLPGTFTPLQKVPPVVVAPPASTPTPASGPTGPSSVVGGIPEPDYNTLGSFGWEAAAAC